jgi:hypothetical protein
MVIIDAAWSMPATGRTVVSEVVEQRRGLGDEELRDDRGPRSRPPYAAHRGGTATVDGEDRFVNRRERLNGEPTARYLHADDLVTYRLR